MDRILPYPPVAEALLSPGSYGSAAREESTGTTEVVVGGGGLLGRHILGVLGPRPVRRVSVRWGDHVQACRRLYALGRDLARQPNRWNLYWCAGLAVFHTPAQQVERERVLVSRLLAGVNDGLERSGSPSNGALFFASSAGGAFAGSERAPFTELSPPVPVNPYGEAKLAVEEEARALSHRWRLPTVSARITNLYGPGQNLAKNQGLVSAIIKAQLSGEPLPLRAALETTRDYIYARDCARMAVAAMEAVRSRTRGTDPYVCKIFASGRPFRIDELLEVAERLFDRPVPVAHEPVAAGPNVDLSVTSRVWTDLASSPFLNIEEGMRAVRSDLRYRLGLN
ncbi:NAD-dependent epimerase/dehydratase family protein [Kitasatospora sp. NPDC101155]|uniref:NAD-dependent epimerase/dehydratase family protein n=1 Tax=Kitasatospora sp. NPDC101155 TaxID=3364097 RepID=UPI00380F1C32